jgi:toxin ParE1/3/4
MQTKGYRLSLAADKDLEDIFDYTSDEFSSNQAVKYLSELESLFQEFCRNPEIGKRRNEIKLDLRSFPYQSHIVFYRILPDFIRIVRVLHGSRDIPRFFD